MRSNQKGTGAIIVTGHKDYLDDEAAKKIADERRYAAALHRENAPDEKNTSCEQH